jgi:hypothetical protein
MTLSPFQSGKVRPVTAYAITPAADPRVIRFG